MPYTPSTTTTTLVVQLGYAFQATFTAGSPNLTSVGFAFAASDVGNVIMVLSGGPDGLTDVTWTTVLTFTDSSHIVLNANIPDNSGPSLVNVILYRPVPNTSPNMIQSGSVEVDLSLTSDSTARFIHESIDGSQIPSVGMPVLITDTEVSVDYFGGTIDQIQVTNVPGTSATVFTECQCVSWNLLCRRRQTGVSDAVTEGDTTLGAANPSSGQFINVRPDQIITYWVTHAMFDDGVRTNLDTTGPQLPTFSSIGSKLSDALDQLVAASTPISGTPQFQWFMDPRRVLNFIKQGSLTAPFNISDVDLSDQNVLIQVQNTVSRQNYFNRGLAEITQVSQTFIGDGVSTSFTLAQAVPLSAMGQVTVTLNGGSQNVGQAGIDLGKEWYYTIGSKTITQIGAATPWANNVSYNFNDVITRNASQSSANLFASLISGNKNNDPNTSPAAWKHWGASGPIQSTDVLVVNFPIFEEFAYDAAAAQNAQQVVESGSGLWEQKINLNALNSVADAESFVTSMVLQAKDFSQQIQIQTYKPGLNIGQTIQVNLAFIGVNSMGSPALGNFFIIDTLKITTSGNRKLFTVTASIDAPIVGGWTTQLKRGLGTAGGVNAHPLSIPLSAAAGGVSAGSKAPPGTVGGAGQWVIEIPVGALNGSNTVFTLSFAPAASIGVPGRLPVIWVFLNGVALNPFAFFGSPALPDFWVVGKMLTINFAPKAADSLWVQYLFTGSGAASKLAFPIYGTGQLDDYTLNVQGALEKHWIMTASADPTFKHSTVVSSILGNHVVPPSDVQWIAPDPNLLDSVAVGFYTYQTTFNLAGFDPSTVSISMQVAVDNNLVLKLNGATVFTLGGGGSGNYTSLHAVTVNSGFIGGLNTFQAVVENTSGGSPNPSCLLIDITAATGTHL